CEVVYSKDEWQAIYIVVKKAQPPDTPPSLAEINLMIAKIGGYLNRKSDPPPGTKIFWRGLKKMKLYQTAIDAFKLIK
ncbi:MAG: IS4 family transposase, partial [Pseudomonadota bacterium]